jgi:hypothetical protein
MTIILLKIEEAVEAFTNNTPPTLKIEVLSVDDPTAGGTAWDKNESSLLRNESLLGFCTGIVR